MKRLICIAALLVASGGLLLAAGCKMENVDFGKVFRSGKALVRSAKPFSWEEEKEIGGTVAARLAASYKLCANQRANQYVKLVAATVSAYSDRPEVLPRVLILQDEVPNAYACPGGYMFVTTGLLKLCGDESELAGVLGHEFAHVARRHTISGLRWKRALSCAGTEAAKYGDKEMQKAYPGFKSAVDKGIDGVVNNRHGVAAETEADALGAEWAARAGYDPAGLGRFIERLPTGEKGRWLESFSVYKNGDTRAQRMLKTLGKKGLPVSGGARNAARYKRELAGVLD